MAIPDPTTCGANPPKIHSPVAPPHHPNLRSPSRSPLSAAPTHAHKAAASARSSHAHPPQPPRDHPWPSPPAASPRRSASPRCPAAAPAPSPSSNAAPRFREALSPSERRPAARARWRRRRSSRLCRTRQWDKVEDKYAVATIGVAGIVALWTAVGAIKAIDKLPLLPGVLEIVGLGYTGWFTYRNLIFQPDREALFSKIKSTYKEITGSSN